MNCYLDCEFNGFGGALLSMAIACEDGNEWYEAVQCNEVIDPWVVEHVIPLLNARQLTQQQFAQSLHTFLNRYESLHIIADWPEDIAYFCKATITGPGQRIRLPRLTFEVDPTLPDTSIHSKTPHNALEDARALRRNSQAILDSST
jgi:hypothetical protein